MATEGARATVTYDNAPVTEVVARFDLVDDLELDIVNLVQLQAMWSDAYPEVTVVPAVERDSDVGSSGFQFHQGVPPIRIWAASGDGSFLVQTQGDMMMMNWRAKYSTAPYPRYSEVRRRLLETLSLLGEFQEARGRAVPQVIGAGFDYYNRIQLADGEAPEDILNFVASTETITGLAGTHVATTYQAEFEAPPTPGDGMLVSTTVRCVPARSESGRALMLSIATSALATNLDIPPTELLDRAHDISCQVFDRSIEPEYRTRWGRA